MLGSIGGASSLLPEELVPPARGDCTGSLRRPRTDLLTKNTGFYFLFSSSLNMVELTKEFETTRYMNSVSLASGLARTRGFARYYFMALRASSHSSFHLARLAPLRVTKNGFTRSVN